MRLSLRNTGGPDEIGLSVARDKLVFALGELTGNIWMMDPENEWLKNELTGATV